MGQWAHYNGHRHTAQVDFISEKRFYVMVDGKDLYPCASKEIARKNIAYYRAQGHKARIVIRTEKRAVERPH